MEFSSYLWTLVYLCATDVPSIISDGTVAYLDPQERVWGLGESGRLFSLSELQGTGALAPLEGIEDFSSSLASYSKTLFRFPLRTRPSNDLSRNTYTVGSITKLVDALKDEAKFLLLFLRSVHTVEVYSVSSSSRRPHDLLFRVQIATAYKDVIKQQRTSFLTELTSRHQRSEYNISPCISNVSKFTINIKDNMSKQPMESQTTWLVANQVGSSKRDILDAARQQCCFPWVGVAMELDDTSSTRKASGPGRVFCFLPMPTETTSKLPVHVNGTFGLNDDRRTIKWPGGERQNDPTARWNQMLVSECLPSCYNMLLKAAVQEHRISAKLLYHAWPNVRSLGQTPWSLVTGHFFQLIFQWECLWAQKYNRWVRVHQAVTVSDSDTIAEVVWRALTACGIQLCGVPDHVLEVLCTFGVQQLTPAFACTTLQNNIFAYQREGYDEKLNLLRFCLRETKNFSILNGLELLPMANSTFMCFSSSRYTANCYICSNDFPRKLLPNIDDKLVDLLGIDDDLHARLTQVANSTPACTQLRVLTVELVASLLPQCYPPGWSTTSVLVLRRGRSFPYDWWTTFWKWIQQHTNDFNLYFFVNQYVVPLITSDNPDSMYVTKLLQNSAVVLMENSDICSPDLLNAFKKLKVLCVSRRHFPHLRHWHLQNFVNRYSPSGVLTAVINSGCQVNTVSFTHTEAKELQRFLISENIMYLTDFHKQILVNLCIFSVLNNAALMSVLEASQMSWQTHAILEPYSFTFSSESLPSNLVIFSCTGNESELIRICPSVSFPDGMLRFLLDELFPMIRYGSCPEDKIDILMEHILRCQFPVLIAQWNSRELINQLTNLPFIRCVEYPNTRKAPHELYDCSDDLLKVIFQEMPVFPLAPFNTPEILQYLRLCKLKTTVSGQQLYDVLDRAASAHSVQPQQTYEQRISQVKAILSYLNKNKGVLRESVKVRGSWNHITLAQALMQFSKNWLPVHFKPPAGYPECLSWKGNGCNHHFVSHKSGHAILCTSSILEHLSYLAGSQLYFVECPEVLRKELGSTLPPIGTVFDHLAHLVSQRRQFKSFTLDKLVHHIYNYLTQNLPNVQLYCGLSDLSSKKLIWIKKKHKFSTPKETVLHERATFQHSLAPFYEIAENADEYIDIFNQFGVKRELSDSDIISVLRKIRDDNGAHVTSQDAWKMVEQILDWIAKHEKTARRKLSANVLIPIQSNSDRPQLVDVSMVSYTDLKFLKIFKQAGAETFFIHEKFAHLAASLGVKPLSKLLNVSHDAFGDVGQHEPLVTRLRSILKDYKDGLTIVKELLQNADDAGATEVTICYDTRTHEIDADSLLYRGMAECHGPALLVHNNATFTDEDFENITKLDAATKENKPLKIGKFGLGFCSVYHITDIPSFISGKWLYIFDPIIKYLGDEISDRLKPGKKLSFTEEIVHESQQLAPYKGLFKFDENKPYQGTLFRFPFRTSASEISSDIYDESRVQGLLSDLKKAGSKLLLFLNNLKSITFSQIGDKYETLFTIEKDSVSDCESSLPPDTQLLKFCNVPNDEGKYTDELWLVASRKENIASKTAVAAVACLMEKAETHYIPREIDGEMFCYLPLTHQTGLPLHISANFAVLKDRIGIHASDGWNIQLMRMVIPKAYYSLLLALKNLCTIGKISTSEYVFCSLWPLVENLKSHTPWDIMVLLFYRLLANSDLFYSTCTRKWLKLERACILAESILSLPSRPDSSPTLRKVLQELNFSLIKLPISYQRHLGKSVINQSTIHEEQFLNIFFENINKAELSTETRDEVLFIIFQVCATNSKDYIRHHLSRRECVPCIPNGLLRKCSQTVDPCASFSKLFDESDEIFPTDIFHSNAHVHFALRNLGIIHRLLPWDLILERAKTIQSLYETDQVSSMERAACILHCIKDQIESEGEAEPDFSRQLVDVAFLPVLKRPRRYPKNLTWYGDDCKLSSGQELIEGEDNAWLAGSQACIVAESEPESLGCGPIPLCAARFLKIKYVPSSSAVVSHLLQIITLYSSEAKIQRDDVMKRFVEDTCEKIYKHLEYVLTQEQIYAGDLEKLKHTQSVWTGIRFISPQCIAKSWNRNGPFLYSIPHQLVGKEKLITSLGIQEDFTVDQYIKALEDVHNSYAGKQITDDRELSTLAEIARKLATKLDSDETSKPLAYKVCYLPDKDGILRKASDLAYNDAQWCAMDEDYHYIHYCINRPTAEKLGVDLVRSKALQQYESSMQNWDGVPFGQGEKLTLRIQNILSDYPWNITVLKELLQNADDARATKMYVILDKRTHGNYKIFSTEWKDLQGPALLIWNDCGFSEKDFEGIQKLGLGSKRSNADTIGQYGIGFNVVYHLTDCPSFFTNGNTLCVLDPHCRYVLGADAVKPGRRYDGVDDKFWNNWSDMKSTYLRHCDSSLKCPEEIAHGKGTLFRFPLRHTQELVRKSKIICSDDETKPSPLTAWKLENELKEWAPKMKEALLFLNNVTELKFFVISADSTSPAMVLTHHFEAQLESSEVSKRNDFLQKARNFTADSQAFVVHYPLCLVEKAPQKEEEHWLIQQGVGDIHNPKQYWQYLSHVKPVHGIATRIKRGDFIHRIFCFLPLPLETRLPVHVNGKFVLDAARSELWQSRETERSDDKHSWNLKLIEAIASSYVDFLVNCRNYYISSKTYDKQDDLWADIKNYYGLFPRWDIGQKPEKEMHRLALEVYKRLSQCNSEVLAVLSKSRDSSNDALSPGSHSKYSTVEILPLTERTDPSKQAYFWDSKDPRVADLKAIPHILKKIGIQLTGAPMFIREHLAQIDEPDKLELLKASPETVYAYYCSYYKQVAPNFPCSVSSSAFKSINDFMMFIKFVVQEEHLPDKVGTFFKFFEPPIGIPLLLTADEMLHQFSEDSQIISSNYSDIFSHCKGTFLHSELHKVKLVPSYFLQPSKDNWGLVNNILKRTLPQTLAVVRLKNASNHIGVQELLSPLWKCLNEEVFEIHIQDILKSWALLLSKENELFSLMAYDELVPLIPPHKARTDTQQQTTIANQLNEEVFQIMEECNMPILNTKIVSVPLCRKFCPQINEHQRVLQNLYHMFKYGELKSLLQDTRLDRKIETLFTYFGKIHFAQEPTHTTQIKSLPLFKNIDDSYCSLSGDAFIWPYHICLSGRDVWMRQLNQTVVFLRPGGVWSKLGDASVLGIKAISPLSLYMRFIFPYFHLFSDVEREQNLQHIRDSPELFSKALHDSKADNESEEKMEGALFIAALKQLPCLTKNGILKPIFEFCNPSIKVFTLFLESNNFPPEKFHDPKWLLFFKHIGLREKVTQIEFLAFCQRIEKGDHSDILEASRSLLSYLFKEDDWHSLDGFLKQVSRIAFVSVDLLKDLAWIIPVAEAENIIQKEKKKFCLTSLSKAAYYDARNLIWSVMPVVHLSSFSQEHYQLEISKKLRKSSHFLRCIGVCTEPKCEDIVQNMLNISRSRFANIDLFDRYTMECKAKKGKESLLFDVVLHCFDHLRKTNQHTPGNLSPLRGVPCIPVCSNGNTSEQVSPILVPPIQVIAYHSDDVRKLVPFLNPLNDCFYPVLHEVLMRMDVNKDICYDNVRYALEVMHKHVKQPLMDVNCITAVKILLKKLYQILSLEHHYVCSGKLYLPSQSRHLIESTKLLFNDKDSYGDSDLKLSGLSYSFMSLLVNRFEELNEYNFRATEFYSTLPEPIRPLLLSTRCVEKLSCTCITDLELTDFAKKLKQAFEFPDFANVTMLMIQGGSSSAGTQPYTETCRKFSQAIEEFCSAVKVYTVANLKVDVYLTLTNPPTKIGTAKVDYVLERDSHSLYIDSESDALTIDLFELLTSSIVSCAAAMGQIDPKGLVQPERAVGFLLRGPTSYQIKQMLHKRGINAKYEPSGRTIFNFSPKLGEAIPEELHHRLKFDLLNVFRPQEWVAYADKDDHFIYARIEYCVPSSCDSDSQDEFDEEPSRYHITVSEEDETGKVVSIVELRKFLLMKEVCRDDGSRELVLYDPESDSIQVWDAIKDEKLQFVLKQIYQELRRISNIKDEDLRRKAVKAMYLKWHPDKNPSPFATKGFQYLRYQAKRILNGLPPEDPEAESSGDIQDPTTDETFSRWDDTASTQGSFCQKEKSSGDQASSDNSALQVFPEPETAKVWLKQAQCDLLAVQNLLKQSSLEKNICAHVCFLAHQVAEKALKAGMYHKFGLHPAVLRWHQLTGHARAIERHISSASGLETLASTLETYYLKTRYPNVYHPPSVPSNYYHLQQAEQAEQTARRILDIIQSIL
jgi:sacsin